VTETSQENIQDWFQLDEEDPGFQLLTKEGIAAVIFYSFILISIICIIIFSISLFYKLSLSLEYIASADRTINWKGSGRKQPLLNSGSIPKFA
jgi:hypothetical protein